tara:strand:+ start:913 stop:1698 length:786 start_codon:yes stop_codon:yes gene_type:complete
MIESTLFPVKEVPVMYDIAGKDKSQPAGYKLIVREDNNKILSCMTNDYKVVTNKQIVDVATPILAKHKAVLKEAVSLADGQKTVWKWVIPDKKIKIAKNDELNPEIIIKNSYDGSLQVNILAGAFRLVCSNGLVIGVTIGKKSFKHNVNNINLENIDEQIEKTIEKTYNLADSFEMLSDTKLNENHIVKLIELFPTQMSEFLVQYLISKKLKTYWDLLNCATYISSHKMKRTYQSTHNLESTLFTNVSKWAKSASKNVVLN